MALTQEQQLRQYLGEVIPEGGTAADTMFTDEQIQDFLGQGGGDLNTALYWGWVAKEAELSNLVTTRTGQAQRNFSDLHKRAVDKVKYYGDLTGIIPTGGRAMGVRSGKIVRR